MMSLIMLSGLQGTGKSTLAQELASELQMPLFAKDYLEAILYNDDLTDGASIFSYHQILALADLHLSLGISCILDAVFPLGGFRQQARYIVDKHHAIFIVIHTYCSDEALHRQRIETRQSTVPWQRITWQDMCHTQSYYEAWSPDEALFLDAVNSLETNIQKALQYIGDFS
ncbi:MAG: ATP-binding protein [Chloroflexota bacterium]